MGTVPLRRCLILREGGASSQPTSPLTFPSPTPTPAPSWTVQPTITGVAQEGQTLTGNAGTIANGTVSGHAWLRNGSAISGANGSTYLLVSADVGANIAYRPTATGAGGSANATSPAVGPVASMPTLTLSGTSFTQGAAAGTVIGNIGNVPSGVTPTVLPGDGRLAIAGSEGAGWKLVVGLTASSAGTITGVSISATGAASWTGSITVNAPTLSLPQSAAIVGHWNSSDITPQADNTALASWTDGKNGIAFTQATTSKQPKYRTGGVNGKPCVELDGVDDFMILASPGVVKTAIDSSTKTTLIVLDSAANGGGGYGCMFGASNGGGSFAFYADASFLRGQLVGANPTPQQAFTGGGYMTFGGSTTSASSLGGSSTNVSRWYARGKPIAASLTGMGTTSSRTIALGCVNADSTPTFLFKGRYYRVVVWNVELTPDEVLQAEAFFNNFYGQTDPAVTYGKYYPFDGDSLRMGVGGSGGNATRSDQAPPAVAAATLGIPLGAWGNYGIGGISIAGSAAKAVNEIDTLYARLGVPIRYCWEEFYNSAQSLTSSQMATATTSHFGARKSALGSNVKIMACTPSDYADTVSRTTTNGVWGPMLAANYVSYGADYIANVHLNSNIGVTNAFETNSGTYWSDATVHLNAAGYAVLAGVISSAITATAGAF